METPVPDSTNRSRITTAKYQSTTVKPLYTGTTTQTVLYIISTHTHACRSDTAHSTLDLRSDLSEAAGHQLVQITLRDILHNGKSHLIIKNN